MKTRTQIKAGTGASSATTTTSNAIAGMANAGA